MNEQFIEVSDQEKINALVETGKDPQNAIRFKVTNEVSEKLINDTSISERVGKTVDKTIDAGLTTVENEAQKAVHKSEKEKLQAYFEEHKEELATAGIEEYTYMKDMKRAVKWHRVCTSLHWFAPGWWMTLIRTFILKAKPFKLILNVLGIVINLLVFSGIGFGIFKLLQIFKIC